MLHALTVLAKAMPGMPADSGWLAAAVVVLLGATAAIDARKGRVPDNLIIIGLVLTTAVEGLSVNWGFAGKHLAIAFATGFALYLINELWHRIRKHDALGMGDAKWTVLAVAAFGLGPALIAWVAGAWLALGWLVLAKILRQPVTRVYFAPFLFIGLLCGIYLMRWKNWSALCCINSL